MNKFDQELSNKLLVRVRNKRDFRITVNQNFKVGRTKDFLLIKNLVKIESLTGQRPIILASFLKKSLIINLRVSMKITEVFPLIQKTPIMWKNYLNNINLSKYYYNDSNFNIKIQKMNKLDNWIKSAYLD